eukprot:2683553-Rhodomonas_salina.1
MLISAHADQRAAYLRAALDEFVHLARACHVLLCTRPHKPPSLKPALLAQRHRALAQANNTRNCSKEMTTDSNCDGNAAEMAHRQTHTKQ